MKPKIAKFGFEIEAEFSERLLEKLRDIGGVTSDGSLRRCPADKVLKFHSLRHPLYEEEFVSEPMSYTPGGKMEANKIFGLLELYRKKKEYHWNSTCGFHVHISFKPKFPVDIWSAEFARFFWDEMQKTFKSASKNRQDNRYCKIDLNEEEIAYANKKYSFINFRAAFMEHKTIEFRIFPGQKPMTLKKYLDFTLETVETFLKNSDTFLNQTTEFEVEGGEPETEEVEKIIKEGKMRRRIKIVASDKDRNIIIN